MLKKSEEKIERVIVGIKTNKAKVNINLVDIFEPTVPFLLSASVRIIFLITLKQRHNNKITLDYSYLTLDDGYTLADYSDNRVRLQWDISF